MLTNMILKVLPVPAKESIKIPTIAMPKMTITGAFTYLLSTVLSHSSDPFLGILASNHRRTLVDVPNFVECHGLHHLQRWAGVSVLAEIQPSSMFAILLQLRGLMAVDAATLSVFHSPCGVSHSLATTYCFASVDWQSPNSYSEFESDTEQAIVRP